jgi:hypothetical protein
LGLPNYVFDRKPDCVILAIVAPKPEKFRSAFPLTPALSELSNHPPEDLPD